MVFRNMLSVIQALPTVVLLSAAFTAQASEYHCSDGEALTLTNSSGTIITRLDGEQHYSHNLHCMWLIQAPEGQRIQVTVVGSDLQYAPTGSNCIGYDYVGVQEDAPVDNDYHDYGADDVNSFQFCGRESPGVFSSRDNDLFIEFKSTDRNIFDERGVTMQFRFFSDNTCPPGWVEDDTRDDSQHCYKLRTLTQSWQSAQSYCRYEHANLVSFRDDTEALFIADMLRSRSDLDYRESVWIGLNDIKTDAKYVWIDGIHSTADYRWVDSSHKSNTYDNCVSMVKHSGSWKEEYCSAANIKSLTENKFVCKTNKRGETRLYDVPADRIEKEGEGSDVPLIGIVISVVVVVLVIFIVILVIVYCARTRQKRSSKRAAITYTDIPLRVAGRGETSQSTPPRQAPTRSGTSPSRQSGYHTPPHPSAPTIPQLSPPSYDEAISASMMSS